MNRDKYQKAHKEAASWHVRLGSPTVDIRDQRAYRDWLEEDPLHGQEYKEFQIVSDRIDDLVHEVDVDPSLASAELSQLIADTRINARGRRPAWLAVAASIVVLAVLVLLAATTGPNYDYQTGSADQRTAYLPDGSTITIAAKSGLDVNFSKTLRQVTMGSGEAYFDVAKDPDRPFVVVIDGYTVQAVGTAFNIRHREGDLAVTVTEGRVEFSGNEQSPLTMSTRQGVKINNERPPRLIDYSDAEMTSISSWKEGKLIFTERKLSDIVREVNNYTPGKIIILDEELENVVGGGVFDTGNSDALIHALEMALPVKSIRITPYLTLLTTK